MITKISDFFFRTLRGRLILSVALVHAVMMSIFIYDLTRRQKQTILESQVETAAVLAETLSSSSAGWISADDIAGLRELVENHRKFPGIKYIIITDQNGLILSHTDYSKEGKYLADLPKDAKFLVLTKNTDLVEVLFPAFLGGQHVGWTRIGLGKNDLVDKLDTSTTNGIIYTLITIIIGSLIAWLVGHRITRRLYSIKETINSVRTGNSNARVNLTGRDEASMLANHFNIMMDTLSEREQQIHLSNDRFKMLFNSASVPFCLISKAGIPVDNNAKFEKTFGFKTADFLIAKNWDKLINRNNNFNSHIDLSLLSLSKNDISQIHGEYILKCKNESECIVEISGNIINDEILLSFYDITGRKKTENKLKESEEYNTAILAAIPDILFVIDKNSTFLDFHTGRPDLLYTDPKEFLGKTIYQILPETLAGKAKQYLDKLFETGKMQIFNLNLNIGKEQKEFECRMILCGNKKAIAITRDITERIKTENSLKESEEMLNTVFENSPIGIEIFDKKSYLKKANKKVDELFGAVSQNLVHVYSLKHDPNFQYKEIWDSLEKGEEISYEIELDFEKVQYPTLKKGISSLRLIITPISDTISKDIGYIIQVIDITDIKRAEKDLISAKEKAEESDRLKSAFLANMSHEIRTPMNGILGFASLLKSPGLSGEKQSEYIKIIEKSGRRMLNIINDIIEISKIESGLVNINITETNINEQLNFVETFFIPEARKKNLELKSEKELIDDKSFVFTDSEKLYAILTNLVKNSIKYTNKGTIKFGYRIKMDTIEFFVKDTGIGIPKDRQTAIFERFIQADISDKLALEGAGLGLAIAKSFVEKLGGTIRVESQENIGSNFYFTIPFKPVQNTITNYNNDESNTALKKGLKILIAEDDENSSILLDTLLRISTNKIFHATDGRECIEICKENPDLDLLLLDIKMPVLNGFDVAKEIRLFNKDIIIIAQTAFSMSGDREKSIDAGCNDYISKPINSKELIVMINKHTC